MKKLINISLIVFVVVVLTILSFGLIVGGNKNIIGQNSGAGNLGSKSQSGKNSNAVALTYNMTEVSKHNLPSDCWMVMTGKVYNLTSYFGSHPGGNSPMALTCGTDATAAYATRDASATVVPKRIKHSAKAQAMLTDYYLGELSK